jgi:NAD(P)-dependent dehydrogenase (short-subunit alcohol dehydrogenase family)
LELNTLSRDRVQGSRQLDGSVAVVTGAGSGLGEATARELAAAGASVCLFDLNGEAADRVRADLTEHGEQAFSERVDVSDAASVGTAIEDVVGLLGAVDIAVSCAALDHVVSVHEMTIEQWDREIGVNLRGPFLLAKAVIPHMQKKGRGDIVNVASTAAVRAWANASAYHASKWGLVGFSRGLGVEAREYGVRVTTIIPGGMKTHFFDRFPEQGIPMPDEAMLQDPRNVAQAILGAVCMPRETAIQEMIVTPINEPSWP